MKVIMVFLSCKERRVSKSHVIKPQPGHGPRDFLKKYMSWVVRGTSHTYLHPRTGDASTNNRNKSNELNVLGQRSRIFHRVTCARVAWRAGFRAAWFLRPV